MRNILSKFLLCLTFTISSMQNEPLTIKEELLTDITTITADAKQRNILLAHAVICAYGIDYTNLPKTLTKQQTQTIHKVKFDELTQSTIQTCTLLFEINATEFSEKGENLLERVLCQWISTPQHTTHDQMSHLFFDALKKSAISLSNNSNEKLCQAVINNKNIESEARSYFELNKFKAFTKNAFIEMLKKHGSNERKLLALTIIALTIKPNYYPMKIQIQHHHNKISKYFIASGIIMATMFGLTHLHLERRFFNFETQAVDIGINAATKAIAHNLGKNITEIRTLVAQASDLVAEGYSRRTATFKTVDLINEIVNQLEAQGILPQSPAGMAKMINIITIMINQLEQEGLQVAQEIPSLLAKAALTLHNVHSMIEKDQMQAQIMLARTWAMIARVYNQTETLIQQANSTLIQTNALEQGIASMFAAPALASSQTGNSNPMLTLLLSGLIKP